MELRLRGIFEEKFERKFSELLAPEVVRFSGAFTVHSGVQTSGISLQSCT